MKNKILNRSVEEYKGYAIRVIPRYPSIIAIPIDAKCYFHPIEDYENGDEAIEELKKIIDEEK